MYLREAMMSCRDLEEMVAKIYEELAGQHAREPEVRRLWKQMAADEKMHARIFSALLASHDVLEDDGPFLVEMRGRIDAVRETLDTAYARVREGIGPSEALELAQAIEASELNTLSGDVVELSRPAVYWLLRVVEKGIDAANEHSARLENYQHKPQGPQRHGRAVPNSTRGH